MIDPPQGRPAGASSADDIREIREQYLGTTEQSGRLWQVVWSQATTIK